MKIEGLVFNDDNKDIENVLKALIEIADNGDIFGTRLKKVYYDLEGKECEVFKYAMCKIIANGKVVETDTEKSADLIDTDFFIGTANGKNVMLEYRTWNSPYINWDEQVDGYDWKARIVLEEPLDECDPNKVGWDALYEKYIELQKENKILNKIVETLEEATDYQYSFDENGDLVC